MKDRDAGLWEAIRRALGRLISSVAVHQLPASRFFMTPEIATDDPLAVFFAPAGRLEEDWHLHGKTFALPLPSAVEGSLGADLASVSSQVSLNAALTMETTPVYAAPLLTACGAVHPCPFSLPGEALTVSSEDVCLTTQGVHAAAVVISSAAVAKLSFSGPSLPKKRMWRGHVTAFNGPDSINLLSLSRTTICSDLTLCARVPVTRIRCAPPAGLRPAQAFAAERRQLAHTSQIPLEDVNLLGVYPYVPVTAVRKLTFEEEGEKLFLWLKPEALAAAAAGRFPRLAVLIVGRQRSTGKVLQAVA